MKKSASNHLCVSEQGVSLHAEVRPWLFSSSRRSYYFLRDTGLDAERSKEAETQVEY